MGIDSLKKMQQPSLSASFHFTQSSSSTNNINNSSSSNFIGGNDGTERNQSFNNNRSSLNLSTADYATIGKKKQEPVYTEQELKECTFKPKISENVCFKYF